MAQSSWFDDDVSHLIQNQLNERYKRDAMVCRPTYENVFHLIKNDKRTFSGLHWIEITKILNSDKEKHKQLGETIRTVLEMDAKGLIRIGFESRITFKGKFYQIVRHPSLMLISILVAILLVVLPIICNNRKERKSTLQQQKKELTKMQTKVAFDILHEKQHTFSR